MIYINLHLMSHKLLSQYIYEGLILIWLIQYAWISYLGLGKSHVWDVWKELNSVKGKSSEPPALQTWLQAIQKTRMIINYTQLSA